MPEDFFRQYLQYVGDTESPAIYHRWSAITGIGALLGRQYHLQHGHFSVNPNIYAMLIGNPGTRKSTAIKTVKKLIIEVGYNTIAADKTTKEKFLLDISGETEELIGVRGGKNAAADILDSNLWGDDDSEVLSRPSAECFIMADEWNDFTSLGNLEFYSLLGTFWDYSGIYKNRIKTGKSVSINNPTISILAGNTPTGFSLAFPTEIVGQGFFSRLVLVYGENTGRKIAFPKKPCPEFTAEMVQYLQRLRATCQGVVSLHPTAEKLLEKIYHEFVGFDDVRFESYFNRRFTHLLKLSLVCAASRMSRTVAEQDVILANTVLTHTEHMMPKALGEFGKGKNSDVANNIVEALSNTTKGLVFKELWALVGHDLEKQAQLGEILSNLRAAEKIQQVGAVFLAKRKIKVEISNECVDYNLLTNEERGL
jgi:hypothetical protein